MKTIEMTINNRTVTVNEGSTVLDAAKSVGIEIPTLCYLAGYAPNTTCMICVVEDMDSGSLILACSTPARDGMIIETDNAKVRESRKDTLDLLLSEHVGDCEAQCQRACPAGMDIPLMIRQIREQEFDRAIETIKNDIALPAVLGRICPAPCEKICNRKSYDNPVSICLLKRFVADIDLAKESPYRPEIIPASGKKVAIAGAGPTGLAAAYYLSRYGHACCIYDSYEKPGGQLRYGVPDEMLPKSVLDAEIEQIRALDVEIRTGQTVGEDITLEELRQEYDAVILATGTVDPDASVDPEIEYAKAGIAINRETFETNLTGVFAGGNTISRGKIAIRSAAHGKFIAHSVSLYLNGLDVTEYPRRFNSVMGKLFEGEETEFVKDAEEFDRVEPSGGIASGYSESEAVNEAKRCFHCDCRKPESCRLRQYADEYGADRRRFKFDQRKPFQKTGQHELVIFEPGKCIKCNMCIEITKKAGEEFGFTFINRGFDVRLTVPFDESLEDGLRKVAKECVEACPTAALAWKTGEKG